MKRGVTLLNPSGNRKKPQNYICRLLILILSWYMTVNVTIKVNIQFLQEKSDTSIFYRNLCITTSGIFAMFLIRQYKSTKELQFQNNTFIFIVDPISFILH